MTSTLMMLAITGLIIIVFGLIVLGVCLLFLKLKEKILTIDFIKKRNSIELHCQDCKNVFLSCYSIKTDVNIYPCPHCAGKNTSELMNDP